MSTNETDPGTQYPRISYDAYGLPRVQVPVPALSWQSSATQTEPEWNRRKGIQVPAEIADKYIRKAVEETIGAELPKDTQIEGGLYRSGGKITINSPALPPNDDNKYVQDIEPRPAKKVT